MLIPSDVSPETYNLVDSEGMPVAVRLPNGKAAASLLEEMITDDLTAAKYRASIVSMVNGNKPYKDTELRNRGEGYRANWNDRQSESIIDARCSADFSQIFDVAQSVEIGFTPGMFTDPRIRDDYAMKIATALTNVIKRDSRIVEASQRAIRDRVTVGLGFLLFDDSANWRPRAIRRGRCFFNRTATSDCTKTEVFYALDAMTVAEAYAHIEDPAGATGEGWHVDRLKRCLVDHFYKGGSRGQFQDNYTLMWEDLENRIRNNDAIYYSRQYDSMPIAHCFIQERTGKVSHYIIPFRGTQSEFIYESYEEYECMDQCVIPLPYDFGDGTLSSVKGMGHRIFSLCTESNRSLMHTIDAAKLSTSLILKNNSSGDNLAFSMLRSGPVTMLDRNLEPIQTSFTPRLDSSFQMRELFQRILSNNTGVFRANMEDTSQRESVKTAEQIRTEASREVKTESDRQFFTYMRWDVVFAEMFRRIISPDCKNDEGSKKFFSICESYGIPREFFTEYGKDIIVSVTRSAGAGSPYSRQTSLLTFKNAAFQSMSEMGRRRIDRELGVILVGADNVDKFIPVADDSQIPSDASSFANLETNDFYEGTPVIVGVDQLHATHLMVHVAEMTRALQMFQQDPVSADVERLGNLLSQGIPHAMRHIEFMSGDPMRKAEVEQYTQAVQRMVPMAQQVLQMAEQIKKAQADEVANLRQQLEEERARNSEANQRYQLEMAKLQILQESEQQKTASLIENRRVKTESQISMSMEKLGAKLAQDMQVFQQDMAKRQADLELMIREKLAKIQVAEAKNVG